MLMTKEVEIKPTGKAIQYYIDLGYDAKHREPLTVSVADLPPKSCVEVVALCDMCKKNTSSIKYASYTKSIDKNGCYLCRDCANIKAKQNEIERYGDVYVRTEEFKNKSKKTLLDKYGVENPLQVDEIKERVRKTNMMKYGYTTPSQAPEIKEKTKNAFIERYGVDCPSKSDVIKQKTRSTNINKYGVYNVMQFAQVRQKVNEALCKNGTQKTSRQQLYLHSIYGGEINYPISYYAADICLIEEKIVIEYDGGGHDLRVTLGRLTKEEFDAKEIVRDKTIKQNGYKQMRIISTKDKLPSDDILLQMLEHTRQYFSDYPNHSWIEFDIDNSSVRNAENKEGLPYNYGELRSIKNVA